MEKRKKEIEGANEILESKKKKDTGTLYQE